MKLGDALSGAAWGLGRMLPVRKNKIVISHFYGRGYGDNPRGIAEALLQQDRPLDIVWLCGSPDEPLPDGIRRGSYGFFSRIFHLSTAKVWIDDCRKGARCKKKNQIYLQTWHGFALKRVEGDAISVLPEGYESYARRDAAQTDLMVAGSRFMEDCYRRAFWYTGPVACFGSPRNDILFSPPAGLREKVYGTLRVPPEKKLVLYAPTFRANGSLEPYKLDAEKVINACQDRFGGEFAMLLRLHPNVADQAKHLSLGSGNVYPATAYPDIQELLAAADVVITDYSSLMFDFALTRRPVFQYAADIADYRKDRDFNFPLEELPFPLAQNDEELERAVLDFDDGAYQKALERFFEKMGIREDGTASKRCADWLLAKMGP